MAGTAGNSVPYESNPYTEAVLPVKINEYLALGKPVVTTPLPHPGLQRKHSVLVVAEGEGEAFVEGIERALALPDDTHTRLTRRHVARLGDWGARLEEMSRLIMTGLGLLRGPGERRPGEASESIITRKDPATCRRK